MRLDFYLVSNILIGHFFKRVPFDGGHHFCLALILNFVGVKVYQFILSVSFFLTKFDTVIFLKCFLLLLFCDKKELCMANTWFEKRK